MKFSLEILSSCILESLLGDVNESTRLHNITTHPCINIHTSKSLKFLKIPKDTMTLRYAPIVLSSTQGFEMLTYNIIYIWRFSFCAPA